MAIAVRLNGSLQVGEGKETRLMNATPIAVPYGQKDKVEILISAEDRHVWLKMDADSARAFANKILQTIAQKIG